MYRRVAATATIALLAVLALAVAAATLPAVVDVEGSGGVGEGTGGGVGQGAGQGAGSADGGFERPEWLAPLIAATFALLRVLGWLALLLVLGLAVYLTVTRRQELLAALRDLLGRIPSAVLQVLALAALVAALLSLWRDGAVPQASPVVPLPGEGGGSTSGSTAIDPQPIAILAVVLGMAAIAVLALWIVRSKSRSSGETGADDGPEAAGPAAAEDGNSGGAGELEQAAGRAADRIASGDPESAVVTAWREMATRLDGIDRRTATPREFAARAVAAGLDREAVDVLTRLFEDVRYGDLVLTDEQESRALAAFRRLESTESAHADRRTEHRTDGRHLFEEDDS